MNEPSWFHVFNSTRSTWLQDDEKSFGAYSGTVEFTDYGSALAVAERAAERTDDVLVVMADHGQAQVQKERPSERAMRLTCSKSPNGNHVSAPLDPQCIHCGIPLVSAHARAAGPERQS